MSAISTLVSGVVDVLPQIVTGGCTLGATWLTYRFGERQRARERARDKVASTNKKIEELGQELFEAVGALHLALRVHVPAHNSWQPKLMTLGSAFLEYMAAKTTGGHALGSAQLGRVVTEANQRELAAAMGLQVPLQRVPAVAGRAAVLADGEVREAALKLGQVAAESGQAYGQARRGRRGRGPPWCRCAVISSAGTGQPGGWGCPGRWAHGGTGRRVVVDGVNRRESFDAEDGRNGGPAPRQADGADPAVPDPDTGAQRPFRWKVGARLRGNRGRFGGTAMRPSGS